MADEQKDIVDGASTTDLQPSDGTPLIDGETTDITSEPTPPSYGSLSGKLRDACKSSTSVAEFLQALFVILSGTRPRGSYTATTKPHETNLNYSVGCNIVNVLVAFVHVAMIVIGAKYKDDCPFENNIPIYLIVGGVVSIFTMSLGFCNCTNAGEEGGKSWLTPIQATLNCFLFIWFICGNVWVFKDYPPKYNTGIHDDQYCDKILYLFAFWLITATYIIISVIFVVVLCVVMCAAFSLKAE